MSIQIKKTIILKIDRKEYDLIMFIRNKMPYGRCLLFTKDAKPIRVEKVTESILFGNEKKSQSVDNLGEKPEIPLKSENI